MTQGMTFQYDASYLEGLYGTVGIDSKNHARYSNPEVDELFAKADATTDQDERAASRSRKSSTTIARRSASCTARFRMPGQRI